MLAVDPQVNARAIFPVASDAPVHDSDQYRPLPFENERAATIAGASVGVVAGCPARGTKLVVRNVLILRILGAADRSQVDGR